MKQIISKVLVTLILSAPLLSYGLDYESANYRSCYSMASNGNDFAGALNNCKSLVESGYQNFATEAFDRCWRYHLKVHTSLGSVLACAKLESEGVNIEMFTSASFRSCFAMASNGNDFAGALPACIQFNHESPNSRFESSNVDACWRTHLRSHTSLRSLISCANIAQGGSSPVPRKSIDEINNSIRISGPTQILLPKDLMIPENEGCGAAKNGVKGVQCWVCQTKALTNDVLYANPRTMLIANAQLLEGGRELRMEVQNDPTGIGSIRCMARDNKTVVPIEDKKSMEKFLEAQDLKVTWPGPVVY